MANKLTAQKIQHLFQLRQKKRRILYLPNRFDNYFSNKLESQGVVCLQNILYYFLLLIIIINIFYSCIKFYE